MELTETRINRNSNSLTYLMIFCLIITTAKGLRFGSSIGPGELGALVISLWLIISNKGKIRNKTNLYTLSFWLSIIFLLLVGWFIRVNFFTMPNPVPRTLFAYIFCMIISYGLLCSNLLNTKIKKTSVIFLKIISAISVVFFMIIVLNIKSIGGVNFYWLGSNRFQGWSLDPNQFTIPFIIVPFLAAYYFFDAKKNAKNKWYILFIIGMVVFIGLATASDSLIAAWQIGFGVSIIYFFIYKISTNKKFKLSYLLVLIPVLSIVLFYFTTHYVETIQMIKGFLMKDNQLETRFNIWLNSIEIIRLSPIFRLGPDVGRDLGRADIMGESHNNILHLGMSTGLIGIVFLLLYYGYFLYNCLKSKDVYLFGAFISLFTFGLTHYTLRHPMYWFMLLLINGLAINERNKFNLEYKLKYDGK